MGELYVTQYEAIDLVVTAVSARTPAGETIRVVVPTVAVGEAAMWQALQAAARQADARAGALAARAGRTDSEDT